MKIFIATYGSRGDFEPFLNFSEYAVSEGHQVILAATAEFTSQVSNPQIKTETVAGAIQELISNQISFLKLIEQFNDTIKPDTVKMFHQVSELIQQHKPDLVLYHPKVMSAPLAARSIGAKSCLVEMIPLSTPTKEFGLLPGIGRSNFGIFNRLTFKLIEISANLFKKDLSQISKSLQQTDNKPDCYMCLVSPNLLDRPSDWPDSAHLVGPWFRDSTDEDLDQELKEFLRQPTVYVGFGSMSDKKFSERIKLIVETLLEMQYQVLLVTGWGRLASDLEFSDPGKVLIRESVLHRKVFPKVEVAIHHGGSGTTHAALSAATPSVVIPFIADQHWWARKLYEKDLAPRPFSKNRITKKKVQKSVIQARAAKPALLEISQQMNIADPVPESLAILLDLLTKR